MLDFYIHGVLLQLFKSYPASYSKRKRKKRNAKSINSLKSLSFNQCTLTNWKQKHSSGLIWRWKDILKKWHLAQSIKFAQEVVTLAALQRAEPSIKRFSCLEGCDSQSEWMPIKLRVKTWSVDAGMMTSRLPAIPQTLTWKSLVMNILLALQGNNGNKGHFIQAAWLTKKKRKTYNKFQTSSGYSVETARRGWKLRWPSDVKDLFFWKFIWLND